MKELKEWLEAEIKKIGSTNYANYTVAVSRNTAYYTVLEKIEELEQQDTPEEESQEDKQYDKFPWKSEGAISAQDMIVGHFDGSGGGHFEEKSTEGEEYVIYTGKTMGLYEYMKRLKNPGKTSEDKLTEKKKKDD